MLEEPVYIDIELRQNVEQEANLASTAVEKLARNSIEAKEEVQKQIVAQETYLKDLRNRLASLRKELSMVKSISDEASQKKIEKAIKAVTKELTEEEAALASLKKEYKNLVQSQVTLEGQMRRVKNNMTELIIAGKKESAEYATLRRELEVLANSHKEVSREQQMLLQSSSEMTGLINGLRGLSGVITASIGAVGALTGEEQAFAKIQTKVQSMIAITMGLQEAQNALHAASAFRVGLMSKATQLWTKANVNLASALNISTVAAKRLMIVATGGLALAITGIIALVDQLHSKKKAALQQDQKIANLVSSSIGQQIANYEKLRKSYNSLGNDIKAKQVYISENKKRFDELGVSINNVSDADNIFINNTTNFEKAMRMRALSAAYMQVASEKYQEYIQKVMSAEREAAAKPSFKDHFFANLPTVGGSSRALNASPEDFQKSRVDKINNSAEEIRKEYDALIDMALESHNKVNALFKETGVEQLVENTTTATNARRDALIKLAQMSKDIEQESTATILATMKEGAEKKLKQIEYEYNKRKQLIEERRREITVLEKATGVDATAQKRELDDLEQLQKKKYEHEVKQATDDYNRAITSIESELNKKFVTFQQERLNELEQHYRDLLEKAKEYAKDSEALQSITQKIEITYEREKSLVIAEEQLKKLDFEERVALRQADIKSDSYNLEVEKEEELLKLQLSYSQKRLEKLLEIQAKGGDAATSIKEAQVEIENLKSALEKIPVKRLEELGSALKGIFSQLSSIGGEVGQIFSNLSKSADSLITLFNKTSKPIDKISAGISGLMQLYDIASDTANHNKEMMQEWIKANESAIHSAKMMRIEQLGYKEGNLFGVENPYARAIAGAKQYSQAIIELNQTAEVLSRGSVQMGTKKVISAKNVLGGAGGGAGVGAALGSIIPGVGTAIGAGVGALFGSLFGASKKKVVPVFQSLAKQYGEIFDKQTFELNPKILQDYNKLNEETKRLVDNWEAIQKKALEAKEQMRNNFKELAGDIGEELSGTLQNIFRGNDIDAALEDFEAKLVETIYSISQQKIFASYFGKYFDELEDRMNSSFEQGGDGDIVDDIIWFSRIYKEGIDEYSEQMKLAMQQLEQEGFVLPESTSPGRKAVAQGIARASQESIDEFNGRMTIVVDRLNVITTAVEENKQLSLDHYMLCKSLSNQVERIATNSEFLRRLEIISNDINRVAYEGIKLKK